MKRFFFPIILALAILPAQPVAAQSAAGDEAGMEPTMMIDKPTAGMLKKGAYAIDGNFFQEGGMLVGISVGIFEPFSFGISYGGTRIIGSEKISMNPLPGVMAKFRILRESVSMPALAIGFDSQGKEPYLDSTNRYTKKSPGFYLVASKNYSFFGNLSIHGGANYSTEKGDGDLNANIFVGAEKSFGPQISLLVEYDFATNDSHSRAVGRGKGYLNAGLRWSWGKGFHLGFDLKDILKNQDKVVVGNRTLFIEFIDTF